MTCHVLPLFCIETSCLKGAIAFQASLDGRSAPWWTSTAHTCAAGSAKGTLIGILAWQCEQGNICLEHLGTFQKRNLGQNTRLAVHSCWLKAEKAKCMSSKKASTGPFPFLHVTTSVRGYQAILLRNVPYGKVRVIPK